MGPLSLRGPVGTKIVDDFSYHANISVDPWGKGSSWLTTYPGSPEQPWLKIQCRGTEGDSVVASRPRGATPSLDYRFQAYDYTHLHHQYMVDDDFVVDNKHGASSSGNVTVCCHIIRNLETMHD